MYLGLDIGRQYVKMVSVEKTKDSFKVLDAGSRLVPEPNSAYDPEKIDQTHWVMAVKELLRQQKLNPRKIKMLTTGINGSLASIKQITTMEIPEMLGLQLRSLFPRHLQRIHLQVLLMWKSAPIQLLE